MIHLIEGKYFFWSKFLNRLFFGLLFLAITSLSFYFFYKTDKETFNYLVFGGILVFSVPLFIIQLLKIIIGTLKSYLFFSPSFLFIDFCLYIGVNHFIKFFKLYDMATIIMPIIIYFAISIIGLLFSFFYYNIKKTVSFIRICRMIKK